MTANDRKVFALCLDYGSNVDLALGPTLVPLAASLLPRDRLNDPSRKWEPRYESSGAPREQAASGKNPYCRRSALTLLLPKIFPFE